MAKLLSHLISLFPRIHALMPRWPHASPLLLLALLFLPFLSLADKLDSLLQIHDTSTIVYYYYNTDRLAAGDIYKVPATRVTGFQRYNPLKQNENFYATFSNVGLAHKNLVFEPQLSDGFYTGMNSFAAYTFNDENTRYFRHLIPVTYLSYFSGGQKEQLFRVIHSHTIKRTVTIGIDFSVINSPGTYINQKSDDKSVVLTGQYFTKNLRFGIISNYHHNKFIVKENGGIVSDSIFENKIITDTRLFDVNLTTAQNLVKESGVLANAYFYLSGKPEIKDSTLTKPPTFHAGRISYTFKYTNQIQIYTDQNPIAEFYKPYGPILDSTKTYDSLQVRSYDNYFAWSNLRMGDRPRHKYLLITFAIENKQTSIGDSISKRNFKTWIPQASVVIRPYGLMVIDLSGKLTLGDFNSGGFILKGMASQSFKSKKDTLGSINLSFVTASQEAGYFFTNFRSNYFRWDTSFVNQLVQQAAFSIIIKGAEAKAEYNLVKNYVYFDQEAHPAQYTGSINLIKLSLMDEFRWKVWGINAQLIYQMNSNKEIIRVPAFMARVSLCPTLPLFQNACVLQPGIDLFYNTAYYASAYMPATRSFYLQDEKKIGNYIYADVFVNLMIKRFRIFAKYEHLNALWGENRYYTVPHYPMQGGIFKWGLSWAFYD